MVFYGHGLDSTKSKEVEEFAQKILGGIGVVGLIGTGLVFAPVITIAAVTIPIAVGVGAAVTASQKSQEELCRPVAICTQEHVIAKNAQDGAQARATTIGVHTSEQYLANFNEGLAYLTDREGIKKNYEIAARYFISALNGENKIEASIYLKRIREKVCKESRNKIDMALSQAIPSSIQIDSRVSSATQRPVLRSFKASVKPAGEHSDEIQTSAEQKVIDKTRRM